MDFRGGIWPLFSWVGANFGCGMVVEKSLRNYKNCVQKVVDIRTMGAYNRDSS